MLILNYLNPDMTGDIGKETLGVEYAHWKDGLRRLNHVHLKEETERLRIPVSPSSTAMQLVYDLVLVPGQ